MGTVNSSNIKNNSLKSNSKGKVKQVVGELTPVAALTP